MPQTGVSPPHAPGSAAVHWTHMVRCLSHMGIAIGHCVSLVQLIGALPPVIEQI